MFPRTLDTRAEAEPQPAADARHMREALELARRGWGRVAPNPMVGAIVARGSEIRGRGWHAEYGTEHAEVVALREAGGEAAGATLYVTLEPCDHVGNTPACTEAIRRAGIARVVVACRDPHRVAGGGADSLRASGVRVDIGVEAEAAMRLNAAFLWRHRTGRPFVSLKLALSLDAMLGARGVRSAVSGPTAWKRVHQLRAAHDAILIGSRTAEVDDPRLTARGEMKPRRPPIRIVLDRSLRLSSDSRLARSTDLGPVWVITDEEGASSDRGRRLAGAGVQIIDIAHDAGGRIGAADLWSALVERGVDSVLVEGGGRTAAALLADRSVQRMHLILAPVFFGETGVPAFPGLDPTGAGEWELTSLEALEPDTYLVLEHASVRSALEEVG